MNENKEEQVTSLSKSRTLEEIAEFWDTHSLADYADQVSEVEFEVRASRHRVGDALVPQTVKKIVETNDSSHISRRKTGMKRRFSAKRILLVTLFLVLAVLGTQVKRVSAFFGNLHAVSVLLRVETEIMQNSPAGQYYESLFWKHNDELMGIASEYSENDEEFWRVTRSFVPELEALLNGEGDTVYVTAEDIKGLKAELEWLASVGSNSLREDIETESQRLPLESFIGMSMTDALDYIDSTWSQEPVLSPTLVPDSDGKWAYSILNGVYIEYPVSFHLQRSSSDPSMAYFIPSAGGTPEGWALGVMKIHVWNLPVEQRDQLDLSLIYPAATKWKQSLLVGQFVGAEYLLGNDSQPKISLEAYLYNEENQIAVSAWLMISDLSSINANDYAGTIDQKYEYFQHLLQNVRFVQP